MARAPYVTIAQDPLALSAPQLLDGLRQLLPAALLNCARAHLYPMPLGSSLGSGRSSVKQNKLWVHLPSFGVIPMWDVGIGRVEEAFGRPQCRTEIIRLADVQKQAPG